MLGNPVTILWMSVVSGYLIKHYDWRWMFIIEGLPAVIWAFFWWRLVDDRPGWPRCLTWRRCWQWWACPGRPTACKSASASSGRRC